MRILAAVFTAALAAYPAAAACIDPLCALSAGAPPAWVRPAGCCCAAPRGWGFYLRQKYRNDCRAPLVIVDELGARTFVRER